MGHYNFQCPRKKRKGKDAPVAASAEMSQFAFRFDREYALMASSLDGEMALMAGHGDTNTGSSSWYIDSGALRHMSGLQEQFSELSPRTNQQDTVLGDDSTVKSCKCW